MPIGMPMNDSNMKLDSVDHLNEDISHSIDKLIILCNDEDNEVRYRALEALQCVKSNETEKAVYEGLKDHDELVRATSLEILGYWKEKESEDRVAILLTDSSQIVRSAAAISLAQVGSSKYSDRVKELLKTADSEDKVGLYYYLCKIGMHEYLPLFLNGLFDSFYRVRCATANLVIDIVDEKNLSFMRNFFELLLKEEKTEAAKSSIKNAINDLSELAKNGNEAGP